MALTDEAINKIKGMIVAGELAAGDRLPPEKELSEKLGLSRSSLREAVKALEIVRVLDVRRGDGTYVTSLEPQMLNEAISFVVDLHQDSTVLEIFAVRRMLEPAAAAMAASKLSPDGVAALRANISSVNAADTTIEELVENDLQFHRLINQASGNQYLLSLLDGMSSSTIRARIWRGLTQEGAVERTLNEHAAIADALSRGDGELARALVTAHVSGVEGWLRKALEHQE
ncbi:FadR/GntR family transcriptional regulator [Psychromicrobium xiongbiense]|uniref:FadR/GntR family transcriptional regulator n=1 Tax=Psychromicrobium xiongbiense TaxID=3051184 RepID=UPI002555AEE0|nr:FadR/GntR family transcriptional regulator [Psychromicrobium sp. YIM S02556]